MKCPNQTHIVMPAALIVQTKKHQMCNSYSQTVRIFKSISQSWWEIWFYCLYVCPSHPHTNSIDIPQQEGEKSTPPSVSIRRDQSIIQSINHLKNACLSDVCNTFILMDYMHYGRAADLICIPRCADYKITLLMHWFSLHKIDGTDEQKGTTDDACGPKNAKINK